MISVLKGHRIGASPMVKRTSLVPICGMTMGKKDPAGKNSRRALCLKGSLLLFLGPYWVPIYISGSLFSVFWLHSREECQFSRSACIQQ